MISLLFSVGLIFLCLKMGIFAWRAAWGIFKFVLFVIAFPLIILVLFVAGIVYLALPLLLIGIIVSIVISATA